MLEHATPPAVNVNERLELRRPASEYKWMVWVGGALAALGAFALCLSLWAAVRVSEHDEMTATFSAFANLVFFVAMSVLFVHGVKRTRGGDVIALILSPDGFSVPEKGIDTISWRGVAEIVKTKGPAPLLRIDLVPDAADRSFPRIHQQLWLRATNWSFRLAVQVLPQGLSMSLDDLVRTTKDFAAAHGGPKSI